ncbi:MAG TPA: hypothetical protein VGD67_08100 [Pseudonocardiaceae bacterium]
MTAPPPVDDQELAAAVRTALDRADPVPIGLDDRVRFAIDLRDAESELAGLTEAPAAAARATELTRTITFESASLTITVTLTPLGDGGHRLDGWLLPGGRLTVELRLPAERWRVTSDDTGRFSVDRVPAGRLRLAVLSVGDDQPLTRTVITPPLEL